MSAMLKVGPDSTDCSVYSTFVMHKKVPQDGAMGSQSAPECPVGLHECPQGRRSGQAVALCITSQSCFKNASGSPEQVDGCSKAHTQQLK